MMTIPTTPIAIPISNSILASFYVEFNEREKPVVLPSKLQNQAFPAVARKRQWNERPNKRPLPARLWRLQIVTLNGLDRSLADYRIISILHADDIAA
jgi:hypothetical protein